LRAAIKAQQLEVSGAVLEREFNLRWLGKPVRRQTAWKWLNGEAIPTQDKLQELAKLLKTETHQLRYGNHVQNHLRAEQVRWDEGIGFLERETFDTFLKLPAPHRKLVRDVIMNLAKVPAEPESASEKPLT
jgi:transcriptional regulator with XRE-family HTH domain